MLDKECNNRISVLEEAAPAVQTRSPQKQILASPQFVGVRSSRTVLISRMEINELNRRKQVGVV